MTISSDNVLVELNPPRVEMEPGGSPVEVAATLQNRTDVVEQYTVEVTGLESDWFTAPVTSIGLFPQDTDQVRITLHPPRRPGVKAGSYKFQVIVRSRSGAVAHSADGVLDLRGYAVFRADLVPRRLTARGKGNFRVQLTNTGTADARLALEARDDEDLCTFRFPRGDEQTVAAGARIEVPLTVRPRKSPWVGPDKAYDFALAARPVDARGEPQRVPGQFTHHPPFKSLPIGGFVKLIAVLAILLLLVVAVFATGLADEFGKRTAIASAQICGGLSKVPVLGGACPPPNQVPEETTACTFTAGFKDFAEVEARLVGGCTSNARYDSFGNGLQYTERGVLFWLKGSNTVYLLLDDSVYAFVGGHARLIDGSGRG